MKTQRGFTIVEVLVAATIIAVLAAGGITSYTQANIKARDGRRDTDVQQVRTALELYRNTVGSYPAVNWAGLDGVLNPTYISDTVPTDPKSTASGCAYTYSRTSATTYTITICYEGKADKTYSNP